MAMKVDSDIHVPMRMSYNSSVFSSGQNNNVSITLVFVQNQGNSRQPQLYFVFSIYQRQ